MCDPDKAIFIVGRDERVVYAMFNTANRIPYYGRFTSNSFVITSDEEMIFKHILEKANFRELSGIWHSKSQENEAMLEALFSNTKAIAQKQHFTVVIYNYFEFTKCTIMTSLDNIPSKSIIFLITLPYKSASSALKICTKPITSWNDTINELSALLKPAVPVLQVLTKDTSSWESDLLPIIMQKKGTLQSCTVTEQTITFSYKK